MGQVYVLVSRVISGQTRSASRGVLRARTVHMHQGHAWPRRDGGELGQHTSPTATRSVAAVAKAARHVAGSAAALPGSEWSRGAPHRHPFTSPASSYEIHRATLLQQSLLIANGGRLSDQPYAP